jgi:VWFA-related protein
MANPGAVTLAIGILGIGTVFQDQRPMFRATTNTVVVDVSVLHGSDPVRGLTAAAFSVTDNGVPQRAELISSAVSLDVSVLIDNSGSVGGQLGDFWKDLQAVNELLQAGDRISITTVATVVHELIPLSAVPVALPALPKAAGATAITDGVVQALIQSGSSERPHILIVFTDGQDNLSVSGPTDLKSVARHADSRLEVVLTGGPTPGRTRLGRAATSSDPANAARPFEAAVRASGGDVFRSAGRITEDVKRVLGQFRLSYLVAYEPQGVDSDGWHSIEVQLRPPFTGYSVQARKGYAR